MESFISQIKEFREHILRISTQYKQLRLLKDSLSDDQLIVQMDFAENYSCQSLDEIQSAYWNQMTVTLHPIVIYYKHGQELLHKLVIFVSDEERHNAVLVYTFIKELISHIRNTFEKDITYIHYWTDSPTSQYHNKATFNIISLHKQLFQISVTWSFFDMLVKSSVTTKMMLLCHSRFQVQEKLKYRPHFNGQQTKIKFGYLVEIYCVSFPALHLCHHIPGEANHHLALIKARSRNKKH